MDDAGVIESIEDKVTKAGKPYKSYRISGQFYNDFGGIKSDVQVGDRVSFSYSSKGQFKNLEEVSKLPAGGGGGPSRTNTEGQGEEVSFPLSPAFHGMIFKMAFEWAVAEGTDNDENMLPRIERKFSVLWDLALKLKKEKNVQ